MVKAVTENGLGADPGHLVPAGISLPALLATAALAAGLANLINNLPALLVLLPLAGSSGPGAVLAVLIGVNIGPNLTYTGSLATLLWRRVLRQHGSGPSLREFTVLGLLTVPAAAADADLLIVARDGDRSRLGPKSLGKAARFIVDHAPCMVLLVWPQTAPDIATIPPPPPKPPG